MASWLSIIDTAIDVANLALTRRRRQPDASAPPAIASSALGHIETRLAGVVVAALKEAFDRDTRRLELERSQLEAERERAERALQLELLRQSGEREIGRLRLLAGVAGASWVATLLLISGRVAVGPPRAALGA